MQQIERKNILFSLHSRAMYSAGRTATPRTSHSTTTIPKIPGCALRSYLASAPEHISAACRELIEAYKSTYTAVTDRSLLQYVVSDLLNPALPVTTLHKFVASFPGTPGEVLEELRRCGHSEVLIRIAENPKTREHTLLELACDPDPEVRAAVLENANTPMTAIWQLSADPSDDVRYRQAEVLTTPLRILVRHLKDENPYISARARQTLSMHGVPVASEE